MKSTKSLLCRLAIVSLFCCVLNAQQSVSSSSSAVVPRLVNYSGKAIDAQGKPISGITGITFEIYKDQYEGSPLWMETQNVTADAKGNYTVQLGATKPDGLPQELFSSVEARWLGVRINGGEEQPRVLLLSVPYALKAADAQTLGGMPASAFVLAAPPSGGSVASSSSASSSSNNAGAAPAVSGSGTADYVPLWTDNNGTLGNSAIYQGGTAKKPKIGIGTAKPASTLDVKGGGTIRGELSLPATGTATASGGDNSQPIDLAASVFNSGTGTAVPQTFQWQAEPVGNNTGNASGSLNLLFGTGSNKPSETGLNIASNGQITFANGQTFPGTGTVTSVGSGAGLTGGPITGSGTLSVANAGVTNAMLQNSSLTVTANSPLSGGGAVSLGGSTSLGLKNCSSNQVLEFISGAWTCTNPATGTVTSVGLSAPSSDFTVSGSPVITSGTLGLTWTVAPTSTDTANAIVKRDATGSFSAGLITASTSSSSAAVTATDASSSGSIGVYSTSTYGYGVYGSSTYGLAGVYGTSTGNYGVYGTSTDSGGVLGEGPSGVLGYGGSVGVYGQGGSVGVEGQVGGSAIGVYGGSDSGPGVLGQASSGGWAVYGNGTSGATGVLAGSDTGYAGWFNGETEVDGNLNVDGTFTADTKKFKIDHPLDPANKYLEHASVESSEMMNIYTGNVTTDTQGEATVQLPEWFEALNTDFRYQLTVIGQFAQAIVSHEIQDHEFQIRTNLPNVKVSWQVTGVRQDAYAKAHPMQVEQDKPEAERGFYRHPELYGAPEEKSVAWAHDAKAMKQWKEARTKGAATDGNEVPEVPAKPWDGRHQPLPVPPGAGLAR